MRLSLRAVDYGFLTIMLGLIYLGSVILLQRLLGSQLASESPLAIVISTLLIAALFNPLRQRLQAIIDRYFFRQKYDAQQILAQFANTARDETNMSALSRELVMVVQETMAPEGIELVLFTMQPEEQDNQPRLENL